MHKAALAPVAWQSSDSSLALSKLECSAKKYIETEILKYKKHNIAQHGLPGKAPNTVRVTALHSGCINPRLGESCGLGGAKA